MGLSVGNFQASCGGDSLEVVSARRRLRGGPPKGLPSDENLRKLAQVYLETQAELWPDLVGSKWLPRVHKNAIDLLTREHQMRFVEGRLCGFDPNDAIDAWDKLGIGYVRFSAAQSNDRSLDDQLFNILRAAAAQRTYIPWVWVFADSAESGTRALRRGYVLVKAVIEQTASHRQPPATVYVDDFTRASRDAVESYKLARYLKAHDKSLKGVSDGFDLDAPHAEIQISALAMFSSMLIEQAREKASRGLQGAARRGTNTHPLPLGYRLVPALDAQGQPITGARGKPLNKREINPVDAEHVRRAFHMFGGELKTYNEVRLYLNEVNAGGKNTWWPVGVRGILTNESYIGKHITGRKRHRIDPETDKNLTKINPEEEWTIIDRPDWRILDDDLWNRVQDRVKEVYEARPKGPGNRNKARSEVYANAMLSGILYCDQCDRPLTFNNGKESCVWCPHGRHRMAGCTLYYKQAHYVETAILNFLRDQVLTDEFAKKLTRSANEYLNTEAAKPPVDLQPLRHRMREIEEQTANLVNALGSGRAGRPESLVRKISECDAELDQLRERVAAVEERERVQLRLLTLGDVQQELDDMRGLLNGSFREVNALLKPILGRVRVFTKNLPERSKPTWFARFDLNLSEHWLQNAGDSQTRCGNTLGPLASRGWSFAMTYELIIDKPAPAYRKLAPQATKLLTEGLTRAEVAARLGTTKATIDTAHRFSVTGETITVINQKRTRRDQLVPLHIQLSDEVARLIEQQGLTRREVANKLSVNPWVVTKAWRLARPEAGDLRKCPIHQKRITRSRAQNAPQESERTATLTD